MQGDLQADEDPQALKTHTLTIGSQAAIHGSATLFTSRVQLPRLSPMPRECKVRLEHVTPIYLISNPTFVVPDNPANPHPTYYNYFNSMEVVIPDISQPYSYNDKYGGYDTVIGILNRDGATNPVAPDQYQIWNHTHIWGDPIPVSPDVLRLNSFQVALRFNIVPPPTTNYLGQPDVQGPTPVASDDVLTMMAKFGDMGSVDPWTLRLTFTYR